MRKGKVEKARKNEGGEVRNNERWEVRRWAVGEVTVSDGRESSECGGNEG